ncbi:MAG: LLM class F420-dependent oxidoreductase [Actinobacteria bacterium]|nr:LLM class F420-dependent oxidoreductase [Actinomycetota bacterium]
MQLNGLGVWSGELRYGDPTEAAADAAALEAMGYTVLWIPDVGGPLFEAFDNLLAATATVTIASGVCNVWHHPPAEVGEWFAGLSTDHRARVMLGIGISHGPLIGDQYGRPLATMREYLDGLDAVGVPAEQRCIAALGPKMLELARDRTAGSHPYLVTPEHTAFAREILGPDKGLFVEQGVVLETDADRAREVAKGAVAFYLGLPNYVNNWKRFGFTDDEIQSCSDRFIDEIFVWGDADTIRARVDAHRAAGADHVCLQVLGASQAPGGNRAVWEALAP